MVSVSEQEIRVKKVTREAVLRWHRLPRDVSVKLVELRGVELKGSIVVGATEDELLALPSSGRGRR
jgi:hypothetical protein